MDPEHCPLRARHSRASSGLPGHVPAFPELPGMQDLAHAWTFKDRRYSASPQGGNVRTRNRLHVPDCGPGRRLPSSAALDRLVSRGCALFPRSRGWLGISNASLFNLPGDSGDRSRKEALPGTWAPAVRGDHTRGRHLPTKFAPPKPSQKPCPIARRSQVLGEISQCPVGKCLHRRGPGGGDKIAFAFRQQPLVLMLCGGHCGLGAVSPIELEGGWSAAPCLPMLRRSTTRFIFRALLCHRTSAASLCR